MLKLYIKSIKYFLLSKSKYLWILSEVFLSVAANLNCSFVKITLEVLDMLCIISIVSRCLIIYTPCILYFSIFDKKNIPPSKYSEVTSWQGYEAGHQHQLSIHGLKLEWRRYSDNSWQFSPHDFLLSTSPYFNDPLQSFKENEFNIIIIYVIIHAFYNLFHLKLIFHPEEVKMCVDSF